ncbi:anti-sigma factor [Streptomyces flavofungini]|uniref:Anti-sigma factor n=1 Tax=Streptomyces flavofungini TaxID=68200 RepID=A0ABS0XFH3_9ACTN|nr:anti-sigma factor [Streptomyces flavofungini]MBJ3810358.1 anti-sigma factor [Streptomyces flavofungini]MBJ3811982.1 anti-sigma factor [Streptomyces flavofungini]GHC51179.1 hypothetical protein GCM10010349_16220 [Streptomyces flavofungini]
MKHLHPADLAELALADEASETFGTRTAHLAECDQCRAELDSLRRVVGAARAVSPDDVPAPPPERVWHAISAELDLTPPTGHDDSRGDRHIQGSKDATGGTRAVAEPQAEAEPLPVPPDEAAEEPVPPRARGRKFPVLLAAACLVAGAALGTGATWWQLRDDGGAARTGTVAALAPLTPGDTQGVARLEESEGPRRQVHIDVTDLPRTNGYFEVWLMDPTHKKLIAVGVLDSEGSATLPVPESVDLADYPLVDVSAQAYNGNPAHSGRSVVRGALRTGP